jgi:DNA primase
VVGGVPLKHHDYTWSQVNNAGLVWFNEQVLQLPGWVVVVEGQIDAMRIHMGYEKVVANLTAKPTDEKLVKLLSADGVILIPDTDSTGEASVARYQAYMNRYKHPFKILRLPAEVKDPDDCHHAFLADLIAEII